MVRIRRANIGCFCFFLYCRRGASLRAKLTAKVTCLAVRPRCFLSRIRATLHALLNRISNLILFGEVYIEQRGRPDDVFFLAHPVTTFWHPIRVY